MLVIITFTKNNLEGRILHNLPHIHKTFPILRHYIREIDGNSGMYYLRSDDGENVTQCHFEISDSQLSFTLFDGKLKKELQKMLIFRLVEKLAEKAYIVTEKMNLFYDLKNFFLIEKDKSYKIGTDYESIIPVDIKHIPLEIRHI